MDFSKLEQQGWLEFYLIRWFISSISLFPTRTVIPACSWSGKRVDGRGYLVGPDAASSTISAVASQPCVRSGWMEIWAEREVGLFVRDFNPVLPQAGPRPSRPPLRLDRRGGHD